MPGACLASTPSLRVFITGSMLRRARVTPVGHDWRPFQVSRLRKNAKRTSAVLADDPYPISVPSMESLLSPHKAYHYPLGRVSSQQAIGEYGIVV